MSSLRQTQAAWFLLWLLAACESPEFLDGSRAFGKSRGEDTADRECRIALRHVQRDWPADTPGPVTECTETGCWSVWKGEIDVADAAVQRGASVYVQYRVNNLSGTSVRPWQVTQATAKEGVFGIFKAFAFRLVDHTFSAGTSFTSLTQSQLELIPYLEFSDGTRVFDHNRNVGDLDNYRVAAANNWRVGDEGGVCPPVRPAWLGNARVKIDRLATGPCDGGEAASASAVLYDGWPRVRASNTMFCFDAWRPGVTDFDNPDLWLQLSARLYFRWRYEDVLFSIPIDFIGRDGNDAVYGVDLRQFDPFSPDRCPEHPTWVELGQDYDRSVAELEFFVAVSDVALRPVDGEFFRVRYEDRAFNAWRDEHCE